MGFRCSYRVQKKKLKYKNNELYTSHCLRFSGYLEEIPVKVKRKKAITNNRVADPQKSSLKTKYLGKGEYVGITVDGDNFYLGKDGTVKHNSYHFCFALPLWRMFSYDKPLPFQRELKDNIHRKETMIITNESSLGVNHLSD